VRVNDASFLEMQRLLRRMSHHDQLRIDGRTADRLLDGTMTSDDAPPRYRRVALAVEMLAEPATEAEMANEAGAVATIASMVRASAAPVASAWTPSLVRRPAPAPRRSLRLVTVTLVGGLTLFGGLAAANALPGAVQRVTAQVLEDVGVTVPSPDPAAGDHPNVRGQSGSHAVDPASHSGGVSSSHTTHATGGDNGATVSSDASDGKSHAGQQNPTTATVPSTGKPDATGKPDTTVKPDKSSSSGSSDSLNLPNNEP
jgi:hypothetical protein